MVDASKTPTDASKTPTKPIQPANRLPDPAKTQAAKGSGDKAKQDAKPGSQKDDAGKKGDRRKSIFRVKIGGKLEFSSLLGDILGRAYVRLSTYQHNTARFILNDPDQKIRLAIKDETDIEIEVGFIDGERRNVFVGKIYSLGRVPPDGTEVVAIDPSYQLQNVTGSSVQYTADQPGKADASAAIKQSFTGVASYYGKEFAGKKTANGEIFDPKALTAAHKTLPFGSIVRVTNLGNNQAVIVRINDRGPFIEGRDLDLTEAAAKAIGLDGPGHGQVKIDVLDPTTKTSANGTIAPNTVTNPSSAATDGVTSTQNAVKLRDQVSQSAAAKQPQQATTAQQFVEGSGGNLKFSINSDVKLPTMGAVQVGQSQMTKATQDALLRGDVVVNRGNTVIQTAPGQGEATGIVLDYVGNRPAFFGKPRVFKRAHIQLQSGSGALTVSGMNVGDKQMVGATVVTPGKPGPYDPNTVIQVPDWGKIKLGDPLFPGCSFTWGDVSRGGVRVPTKAVMERAVALAQRVQPLVDKTKQVWTITSWYRRPQDNASAGGASGSRHLFGDAIDVNFPGMEKLHAQLHPDSSGWRGGIAISPGNFIHIDVSEDSPFRRWTY